MMMLSITWFESNCPYGKGKRTKLTLSPWVTIFEIFLNMGWVAFKPRRKIKLISRAYFLHNTYKTFQSLVHASTAESFRATPSQTLLLASCSVLDGSPLYINRSGFDAPLRKEPKTVNSTSLICKVIAEAIAFC